MKKYGEAYRVFGKVEKFCDLIKENSFEPYEHSNNLIQITSYKVNRVIGKIFDKDILVIYTDKKEKGEDIKKEVSRLEDLAKNFQNEIE